MTVTVTLYKEDHKTSVITNSRSSSSVQDTALISKALREREESEKWQTQEQDLDCQHRCWWSLDSVLSWPYWFQPCRYCYNCAAIANQLYSGECKMLNLLLLLLRHLLYRMVVRIMVMVPLYAISSLISLFSVEAAFFIDAIRDIYEVRLFFFTTGSVDAFGSKIPSYSPTDAGNYSEPLPTGLRDLLFLRSPAIISRWRTISPHPTPWSAT